MTPIPAYARQPTPLEMALVTASHSCTLMEAEVALRVIKDHGDPSVPEHRAAFWALHRQVGRAYGHRPAPAKWEAP